MKTDDCSNIFVFLIILYMSTAVYSVENQKKYDLMHKYPHLYCMLKTTAEELTRTPEGIFCAQQKLAILSDQIEMVEKEPSSPTRLRKLQELTLHTAVLSENVHKKKAIQPVQED